VSEVRRTERKGNAVTGKEFAAALSWVMLQTLGQDRTQDELQAAYEEACRLMFAAEAGDAEAIASVAEAGRNFQQTLMLHAEAARLRASKLN